MWVRILGFSLHGTMLRKVVQLVQLREFSTYVHEKGIGHQILTPFFRQPPIKFHLKIIHTIHAKTSQKILIVTLLTSMNNME
jgi:hypothetical protein